MSDQEDYVFSEDSDGSDGVGSDGGGSDGEEEEDDSIRNDLANTTFEELLGMREKLGTKIYRDSVLKQLGKTAEEAEDGEAEEDSDSDQEQVHTSKGGRKHRPALPKRSAKSQPVETSSKRLDTRHNFTVVQTNAPKSTITFRDPRFDSQCGTFKVDKFEANYSFLSEMKRRELETIKKQLKRVKSEEEKTKLRKSIQILKSQLRSEAQKTKERQVEKKVKTNLAKDLDLTLKEPTLTTTNAKPKKPQALVNKATLKRAQLVEKFKELKKKGKLDKYIERKRKKNAGKERKYINLDNQF